MYDEFGGFPRELPDFLSRLQFCNTIENQKENVEAYKKIVTQPLCLLYKALLPTVLDCSVLLETKQTRCVSTPYTDRRFSSGTPLKEYLYIRFKRYGRTEDIPGLYFDMGADDYSYGLRIYSQTSRGAAALRDRIAGDLKAYSRELEKIRQHGFCTFGETYKKDHYAELPECDAKELLNRKSFYVGKNVAVNERIYTPELAREIADGFMTMKALLKLLME